MRAGREQDPPRADRPRPRALLEQHDGVACDRDGARTGHQPGAAPLDRLDQRTAALVVAAECGRVLDLEPRAELLVDLTPERDPLVDHADRQAGTGRHGTGGEPCGPAADDEEVVALSAHAVRRF